MPAFTTNQWAILFLVLLLGWLLGLVSRSGAGKWRRAYEAERDARIEEQREHAAALGTAHARVVELESARTAARPAAVSSAMVGAATITTPTGSAATPATLDLTRDDLARISGIGAAGESRLNAEGIHRYADIIGLSPAEETALEERMGADHGYIEQERWREQAALLAEGKIDEHGSRFA